MTDKALDLAIASRLAWRRRAENAEAILEDAVILLHALLGLEKGSSEAALDFIDRHASLMEDTKND